MRDVVDGTADSSRTVSNLTKFSASILSRESMKGVAASNPKSQNRLVLAFLHLQHMHGKHSFACCWQVTETGLETPQGSHGG